jgi:hypothetical protein
MLKLNVDCCSVTAQDNEPRVTFTTRKFSSLNEEYPALTVIREHGRKQLQVKTSIYLK